MQRYLQSEIQKDLAKKMVLLSGPRQVGKTTLAKALQSAFQRPQYLNQDDLADAKTIRQRSWPLNTDLLILDEIHKAKGWKSLLKGVFDSRPAGQSILVTGSARLDTFRQSGESLAGRYYQYRLHPLSVKELTPAMDPHQALDSLMRLGGFPEPFLSASQDEAARWRRQYYGDLVREDIMDFSRIHELRSIRLLLEMLRKRVGTPLSIAALAQDLQLAPGTVRKYVEILENLHIIFLVRPFHKNIARSILKEPKAYFYDSGYVEGDEGLRLENTVAHCLLKQVHYLQDTQGKDLSLHYLRTKDDKEVDFALAEGEALKTLIEVKLSDTEPARALGQFKARFPEAEALQLVHNARRDEQKGPLHIVRAGAWLATLAA